jgi:molecular chaperone DnaJ
MKGKGVKNIRGYGKGDQYVTVKVVTPKNLTAQQKDLLQQLSATFQSVEPADAAKEGGKKKEEKSEKSKGFFGKMKEAVEDLFDEE